MRVSSMAMAFGTTLLLGFFLWASGCSDLSDDCELNLNCTLNENKACSKVIYPVECDKCLQTSCCPEMAACIALPDCLGYCFNNVLPAPELCTSFAGDLKNVFGAANQCLTTTCATACILPDTCNPVTHNGCPEVGSSCDLAYPGRFYCFDPPPAPQMPAQICQPCDFHEFPYCGSGLRCHPNSKTCARYCCDDSDCGTGRCELDPLLALGAKPLNPDDKVGICVNKDPTKLEPACDAPPATMAPSKGVCFAGFAGVPTP